MLNRKQRRSSKSYYNKKLRTAQMDEFEDITEEGREGLSQSTLGTYMGFYKNSLYSIQHFHRENTQFIGIRRHDQQPSCPWNHKQLISRYVWGHDAYAIEIFPPTDRLVDCANIYWLWSGPKIDKVASKISIGSQL